MAMPRPVSPAGSYNRPLPRSQCPRRRRCIDVDDASIDILGNVHPVLVVEDDTDGTGHGYRRIDVCSGSQVDAADSRICAISVGKVDVAAPGLMRICSPKSRAGTTEVLLKNGKGRLRPRYKHRTCKYLLGSW